jgi:pSer/pThr/pTyr-binding forkhead associated (FHA) protein
MRLPRSEERDGFPWGGRRVSADSHERGGAMILICNGGFEGMTYELGEEETIIGRNPTTDITLLDEGISREHAVILFDAETGGWAVEDLQSTNGTKVNGRRVRSQPLQDGDRIEIGTTVFQFVVKPR